jgi:uncharacterized MnhB-related membrane protein
LGSETLLFYLLGGITVVMSLLVIAQRNPIYSVLLLIGSFGGLSGLYVLLSAPFAAVIQIIVYAGAIMVLFLFVVMLLNAPHEDTDQDLAAARAGAEAAAETGDGRAIDAPGAKVECGNAVRGPAGGRARRRACLGARPGCRIGPVRRRGGQLGQHDWQVTVHRLFVRVRGDLRADSRSDARRRGAGQARDPR